MRKCSIIVYIEKDAGRILSGIDRDSFIICADGGTEYALSEGIIPDLVIGDFDSYKGVLPEDIPRIVLPEEKDDTDTHYCVKYAMEQGYSDITVYGGLGGRFDHSVSNLQTLRYAAENGFETEIYPAVWGKYGRAAGPKRNKEIAEISDYIICFWDGKSKGTKSLLNFAEKYGKL